MQQLTKGSTSKFYCTLAERSVLTTPNYLFVFTNRMTKTVIAFVQLYASDVSSYKYRYNRFNLVVDTYFTGAAEGIYDYAIYEQASAVNIDPTGLTALETGNVYLYPASSNYNPVKYTGQDNKTKVYNG